MVGVDLLAAIVYFSPLVGIGGDPPARPESGADRVGSQAAAGSPVARNLPKRSSSASKTVAEFFKEALSFAGLGNATPSFGKLTGLMACIEQAKYKVKKKGPGGCSPWRLNGPFRQLHLVGQVHQRAGTGQMFFIINSVTLVANHRRWLN